MTISCDESGNEGENLTRAGSRVFAHASTDLSVADASTIMAHVRALTGHKSGELKSSVVLKNSNQPVLEWLLTDALPLGHANVHLTEKRYFVSGKVIDLVVENLLYSRGHELFRTGRARDLALVVYRDAPAQLGPDWDEALDQFNTMLRLKVRNGKPKATLDDFYTSIEKVRSRSTGKLKNVLRLVHAGRSEAADLILHLPTTSEKYLSLDPLFAALGQTARTWYDRTGLPVEVVHDETSLLTEDRIASLRTGLGAAGVATLGVPPVDLRGVTLVKSELDPRVQVADLLAGAGRAVAEEALDGNLHPLLPKLRPHLDPDSIWADTGSWSILTEGAPTTT